MNICLGYKREIVLLDDCLMFISSKDKIDGIYASLQVYFKIEDDVDLNKYFGIYLDLRL